jgi:ribosomal protein L37AE/L43A
MSGAFYRRLRITSGDRVAAGVSGRHARRMPFVVPAGTKSYRRGVRKVWSSYRPVHCCDECERRREIPRSGSFVPRSASADYSNAMDVGIRAISATAFVFRDDHARLRRAIETARVTTTRLCMRSVDVRRTGRIVDRIQLSALLQRERKQTHPALSATARRKFPDVIERALAVRIRSRQLQSF